MKTITSLCLWLGRLTAVLLFLLWGAFFIEHLTEWFGPSVPRPPVMVWINMAFHLVMLAGLGMMIKWHRLGTCIMAAGTIAFIIGIGFHRFPYVLLLNVIPVGFLETYRFAKQ
jgi:hypothetical protein